jgi:Tfp pilus assembly protein FimT
MQQNRRFRPSRRRWSRRLPRYFQGFTLMETLIIVVVVGIVATLAIPSLAGMMESVRLTQSVTELRIALQDSQRYAIRTSKACDISLVIPGDGQQGTEISGPCLSSSQKLPDGVKISTNLVSTLVGGPAAQKTVPAGITIQPASLGPTLIAVSSDTTTNNGITNGSKTQTNQATDSTQTCKSSVKCLPGTVDPAETVDLAETVQVGIVYGRYGGADFTVETGVTPPDSPADPSGKFVTYLPNRPEGKKRCVAISRTLGLTRVGIYSGELDPAAITDGGVCTATDWSTQ